MLFDLNLSPLYMYEKFGDEIQCDEMRCEKDEKKKNELMGEKIRLRTEIVLLNYGSRLTSHLHVNAFFCV